MRKIIFAVLVGCMCLGLNACSSSDKEEEKETEKNKEYRINDVVKMEDRTFQVSKVTTSKGEEYSYPKKGKVFVLIEVKIENTSKEEISYNALDFEIQNPQGQINNIGFGLLSLDNSLNSGDLAPGGKVSGIVVAEEAKADVDKLILIYNVGVFNKKEVKVTLN